MHGVTQRMLTLTLRQLERDGLVVRHDFDEVPPRVEYELSETGMELLVRLVPLWTWIVENADSFREARQRFATQHDDADM
jgi:DNA-binding HxlR family transcriptional regulator